jgi:hypothetical protein
MKLQDKQEHVASVDLQVVIDDRGDFFLGQQLTGLLVEVVPDKHLKWAILCGECIDNRPVTPPKL